MRTQNDPILPTLIAAALLMLATVTACGDEDSGAGPSDRHASFPTPAVSLSTSTEPGKIVTLAEVPSMRHWRSV